MSSGGAMMNINKDFLSRDNSISIKGIMSILILLHHLSMYCNFGKIYSLIFMNSGSLLLPSFYFILDMVCLRATRIRKTT